MYEVYIGCEEWQDFETVDTLAEVNEFFDRWKEENYTMGSYPADEAFYEDTETGETVKVRMEG